MFRRRRPSAAAPTAPAPRTAERDADRPEVGPGIGSVGGIDLTERLRGDDWVLPRALHQGVEPRWSLVGTVGSETATPVDPAGLVVGEGWALDWWVGGDDRWHLPSREAAVRQQLLADAPVVETLLRIPGGDAIHRAHGIRTPRRQGDEWVVTEIENATAVPFAVTLVVRPFVAGGVGSVSEITIEEVDGGEGRDVAHLVRADGRPVLLVPRRPARVAAGSLANGDAASAVLSGEAGRDLIDARCDEGLATLALLFPLTHTSTLRTLIPIGDCESDVAYPSVVPDAATVAAGWDVHRRGVRAELPEAGLDSAFERAHGHVQLASDGVVVRRDGHRERALDPGATEVILGAFDLLARPADVGSVVARWGDELADATPQIDALFLTTISRHWLLHRADALLDWMLPEVAAAVERIDRAARRGRLDPIDHRRAAEALELATDLMRAVGQDAAARDVARVGARVADGASTEPSSPADALLAAARLAARGEAAGHAEIRRLLGEATAASTWPGPGGDGRTLGHDLAASAAYVHAALSLLVGTRDGGLDLVPHLPEDWYGAPIELHDAPTAHGVLSFAVRWHGMRPALLWEIEPHPGVSSVELRIPGLDPSWRSTEPRGDALLAEMRPPQGLQRLKIVAEHPDIDPEMRRPGTDPEPPSAPMPEGGSFG